jgi:hypothetical protein
MIGVALHIYVAKLDVGDPIEYLMYCGICNVKRYMTKQIRSNVIQICRDCGTKHNLHKVKVGAYDTYECRKCGSHNVDTYEIHYHEEDSKFNAIEDTSADFGEELAASQFVIDFERTLTPGTNVHKVYCLLRDGLRDDMDVDNYIGAIAEALGGCSSTNAMMVVKKLRKRVAAFSEEYSSDLVGGMVNGR